MPPISRRVFVAGATATLATPAFATPGVPMSTDTEIAIVGGGPAGLSAALVLGRSRRATVLFDAGSPRNAPAAAAHNLYTRDGTPPLELNRIAREQLVPYDTVEVRDVAITHAERRSDGTFLLRDAAGTETSARQLVLATGVTDVLPEVEGVRELWGTGVFHCPYCHGWEVRDQPFVLMVNDPRGLHLAVMLRGWSSDITVCPMPTVPVPEEKVAELTALGLRVKPAVKRLVPGAQGEAADVVLVDGEHLGPAAVFLATPFRQRSDLAVQLGCTVHTEGMFQGMVQVDERGFSGVDGLWVVGDASVGMPQVVSAAAQGSLTAAMVNGELLMAGVLPRGAG